MGRGLLMLSLFVSSESHSCADWVNDPTVGGGRGRDQG